MTIETVSVIKELGGIIGESLKFLLQSRRQLTSRAQRQETARNVQQAAVGTTEAPNIGDFNRGAGETGTASLQVLAAAKSLSSGSNRPQARGRPLSANGTCSLTFGGIRPAHHERGPH